MSELHLHPAELNGVRFLEAAPDAALVISPNDSSAFFEACSNARVRAAVLYAANLPPGFFDPSSGVAGALLQRLRLYGGVRLAVVAPRDLVPRSQYFDALLDAERGDGHFAVFETLADARSWLTGAGAEPLGLRSKTVHVAQYDARWPELCSDEVGRLADVISAAGLPTLIFEHVGSTAVPGLDAKPILDIAAGRRVEISSSTYVSVLERAGYVVRGNGGLPGREFFRRGELRTHHLHLVELGGEHWQRYLKFRDTLRANVTLRGEYAALKHELAAQYPFDREAYIEGKTAFVESVVSSK